VTDDIRTTAGKIADLRRRRLQAETNGTPEAIEKRHSQGKLTARERIARLVDPGSFVEMDAFSRHRSSNFGMDKNRIYGDGVVTGHATVDGRAIAIYSQDFLTFGGSLGEVVGEKIVKVMEFALKSGIPIVGINDSGGARIQEGVASLSQYGEIFKRNVRASGVIPQISLIMGPTAGGAVYSPAITDFVIMVNETSQMFITGPDVIKAVTGEEVGMEELGGARTHNTKTGNSHYLADSEDDAIDYVKALLSYLPSNNMDESPVLAATESKDVSPSDRALDSLIPDNPNKPYDMKVLVEAILDEADFLEVHTLYAPNILVGFGRIEGHSVGIIANQPQALAGTLDIAASEKAARFVRTCDAFGIPTKDLSRTSFLFQEVFTETRAAPTVTKPCDILPRLLNQFEMDFEEKKKIRIKCSRLAKEIEPCVELMGKTPNSIASVVILLSIGDLFSKKEICEKCSISVPTMNKIEIIVKEFLKRLKE
jgi:propionyl-CoA carboxylase beta chain